MKRNVGQTDIYIRFVLGFLLIFGGAFILLSKISQFGLLLFLVGLVVIGTTLLKWCPFYVFFGYSTHVLDEKYRYKKSEDK